MAEPTMIYKIAVLELLKKSGFPLSNSQLSNFFLEGDLTDYFSAQQAISDDEDAGLISSTTTHNSTTYSLTEEGEHTLKLFRDKLNKAMLEDISRYLATNSIDMKQENSYRANYTKLAAGGYLVHCKISEEDSTLLDLTMKVGSAEQADTICNNWKVRSEDVYTSIMDILIN